jgi:hypothetical protein
MIIDFVPGQLIIDERTPTYTRYILVVSVEKASRVDNYFIGVGIGVTFRGDGMPMRLTSHRLTWSFGDGRYVTTRDPPGKAR